MQEMFTHRLAVEHGVEADNLHNLDGAHLHALRHLGNYLLADVAHFILRVKEQGNHGRALEGVARDELVEFFAQLFGNHLCTRPPTDRYS
jgi:hypothetical protein